MSLNVSRNKVPIIINFPAYPQLLAYPKMAEQERTSTSIAFDMTKPLTFNNLLLWVLSALGTGVVQLKINSIITIINQRH